MNFIRIGFKLRISNSIAANKEMQKRHLACMMAYGKEMPPTPREPRIQHRARRLPQRKDDEDPFKDRKLLMVSLFIYFSK